MGALCDDPRNRRAELQNILLRSWGPTGALSLKPDLLDVVIQVLFSGKCPDTSGMLTTRRIYWIFSQVCTVLYSTLLHLPPLRFHCVGGRWNRTQDKNLYDLTRSGATKSGRNGDRTPSQCPLPPPPPLYSGPAPAVAPHPHPSVGSGPPAPSPLIA
jgi:hypothetical protein